VGGVGACANWTKASETVNASGCGGGRSGGRVLARGGVRGILHSSSSIQPPHAGQWAAGIYRGGMAAGLRTEVQCQEGERAQLPARQQPVRLEARRFPRVMASRGAPYKQGGHCRKED
jgi:hypothetical protein